MPRYFALITEQALAEEIFNVGFVHEDTEATHEELFQKYDLDSHKIVSIEEGDFVSAVERHAHCLNIKRLTPKIEADLSKVSFDTENLEGEKGRTYGGSESIGGFRTLPNGFTYFGVCAGGDWEIPIFFIIYWDGKKLRGYIPKDGNTWNKTLKSAYGNNREKDGFDMLSQYGTELEKEESKDEEFGVWDGEQCYDHFDWLVKIDPVKVIADIEQRIKEKK